MAGSIRNRVRQAAAHDEPVEIDASVPDLELSLNEHREEFEIYSLKVRFEELRQKQQETRDLHDLRFEYTDKIFKLVCGWLLCVILSVMLSGFKVWSFSLSDAVLIAFITSTTINVVGLFIVVAKWMYPASSSALKADHQNINPDSTSMNPKPKNKIAPKP